MKKLELRDLMPLELYERDRKQLMERIIELKHRRRVRVGPNLSFLFENRDTVLFQVQEMMRIERPAKEAEQMELLEAYNPLIAGPMQLSSTLFIEVTEQGEIASRLKSFMGIEESVSLKIGSRKAVKAVFEMGRSTQEKISSVHYIKFNFAPEDMKAFEGDRDQVVLAVDHPNYRASAALAVDLAADLMKELGS